MRVQPRVGRAERRTPGTRVAYRVRAPRRGHDTVGVTPPGVHLAGVGHGRATHGRPRSRVLGVLGGVGATLLVFVLALSLVTGIEAVAGRPLTGGDVGHTTLGDLLHPAD